MRDNLQRIMTDEQNDAYTQKIEADIGPSMTNRRSSRRLVRQRRPIITDAVPAKSFLRMSDLAAGFVRSFAVLSFLQLPANADRSYRR